MDPDRKAYRRPQRLNPRGSGRFGLVARTQNAERSGDTRLVRPADDTFEVIGEGGVSQVAVTVYHVDGAGVG